MIAKELSPQYRFLLNHKYLEAYWRVLLNNGEMIYQDDYSEYSSYGSAWKRLQSYCKQHNLYPIHMTLHYSDNSFNELKPGAKGYFFKRGILSEFLCESNGDNYSTSFQGNRSKTFIVGYLDDDGIHSYTIKVPELFVWNFELRPVTNLYLQEQSLFLSQPCTHLNIATEKLPMDNT